MVPRQRSVVRRASCDSSLRRASSWSKTGTTASESSGPLEGLGAMRRGGAGALVLAASGAASALAGRGGCPGGPHGGPLTGSVRWRRRGGAAGGPRGRQRRARICASASGGVSSARASRTRDRHSKNGTAPQPTSAKRVFGPAWRAFPIINSDCFGRFRKKSELLSTLVTRVP